MNELATQARQLPDALEDLARFVLIGHGRNGGRSMRHHETDPRIGILCKVESDRGYKSHAAAARDIGMNEATLQKRFRDPGTMRLDEVKALAGRSLTPDDALLLIEGRKRRR